MQARWPTPYLCPKTTRVWSVCWRAGRWRSSRLCSCRIATPEVDELHCDGKRPMLILGSELAAFLKARRTSKKQPCQAGEIYCVRCHAPKSPAGDMAEYQPITD